MNKLDDVAAVVCCVGFILCVLLIPFLASMTVRSDYEICRGQAAKTADLEMLFRCEEFR